MSSPLTIYHEKILFYGGAVELAKTVKNSILTIKKKYTDLEEKASNQKIMDNIKNITDFINFINNLPSHSFYLGSFRFEKGEDGKVIYKKINTKGDDDIRITVDEAFDLFNNTKPHKLIVNDTKFVYEIENYLNTLPKDRQYTIEQSLKDRENFKILSFRFENSDKLKIMTNVKIEDETTFIHERISNILRSKQIVEDSLEISVSTDLPNTLSNLGTSISKSASNLTKSASNFIANFSNKKTVK